MRMAMQGTKNKMILFSDFDGTISSQDVGNRLFHHFSGGRSEAVVERWKRNEIDSRQCLIGEGESLRDVTEEEVFAFIDGFAIDPAFHGFVDFARTHGLPLYLLSDGLDIYIRRLLEKNGLAGLTVFANRGTIVNGRFAFEFPYLDHSCGNCANCKGYHIGRLRPAGYTAVYIGDGKSDLCALPHADIVFAKDCLAEYCRKEAIDFLPFDDFSAITQVLTERLATNE